MADDAGNSAFLASARALLEGHGRSSAPSDNLAMRVAGCLGQLQSQMAPLIGIAGFLSVFNRAVHLCQPRFEWLSLVEPGEEGPLSRQRLSARFEQLDAGRGSEAAGHLLSVLLALLCDFLGEDLTERALRRAWPLLPPGSLSSR